MSDDTQGSAERQVVTERMTVGLIPKASADMAELMTLTGLSKTDLVNRAVSLYRFVAEELAGGSDLLVRSRETGEVEKIHLL